MLKDARSVVTFCVFDDGRDYGDDLVGFVDRIVVLQIR